MDDVLQNVREIIGTVATANADEKDQYVKELREQVGTGYYEGRGDTMIAFVAQWIEDFYEEENK